MGWVRTKALTMEQPSAPSLTRWLFAGVLMAIIGVLLFILHASGTVKIISVINIWWVSLMPAGCWTDKPRGLSPQRLPKGAQQAQRQ